MFDNSLMLTANLPVGDKIHSQSNKIVKGAKIKAVDNSTLKNSPDVPSSLTSHVDLK